jgi:NAD(P)-dependent dehydrogenase (short-subunit alcohol dehydrogenase family)
MNVIVHYAGNPGPARDVVTAIIATGGRASAFQADVADEIEVAALFDHAERTYAGIDVVVHTAGIMLLSPLADSISLTWIGCTASTSVARSSSISRRRTGYGPAGPESVDRRLRGGCGVSREY